MKEIKLTKGYVALVDDSDFERVNQFKWHVEINNPGKTSRSIIVVRSTHVKNREGRNVRVRIKLPRFILGIEDPELQVDFEDGDVMNMQKTNLRIRDALRAARGLPKIADATTSAYKGVHWYEPRRKWQVYIYVKGKKKHLGYFESEVEGAKAYDEAAIKKFGAYARLNILTHEVAKVGL